jgi:hypothetical protein
VLINNANPAFNVFTSAGNMNKPASVSAPGNTPNVCNIGNIDMGDFVYRGRQEDEGHVGASNYGSTVKLFAPGTAILSTAITNTPPANDPALGAYGPFSNFSVCDLVENRIQFQANISADVHDGHVDGFSSCCRYCGNNSRSSEGQI